MYVYIYIYVFTYYIYIYYGYGLWIQNHQLPPEFRQGPVLAKERAGLHPDERHGQGGGRHEVHSAGASPAAPSVEKTWISIWKMVENGGKKMNNEETLGNSGNHMIHVDKWCEIMENDELKWKH